MADQHRESRKQQEKRKGWIGIAAAIFTVVVFVLIVIVGRNIGPPAGIHYFVYFDAPDTVPSKATIQDMFAILTRHGVVKDVDNLDAVLDNFVHPEFVEKVLTKQ